MKFKLGDVLCIKDKTSALWNGGGPILVSEKCKTQGQWVDDNTVCLGWLEEYPFYAEHFDYFKKPEPKFKVGDKVISTKNTANTQEGFIGVIMAIDDYEFPIKVVGNKDYSELFAEDELALLNHRDQGVIHNISIERPILEERKLGKVKMELFDEGFPNAVLEVAKVMTWAAENKGYKPHDWKNLPNADTEFSAAASRHKLKALIQKVEGVPALERTDEESYIVHLAHTAFNVLAELELVLTGKIK